MSIFNRTRVDPQELREMAREAQQRFANFEQRYNDMKEQNDGEVSAILCRFIREQYDTSAFEAPNRLFGSWLNREGEAV